MLRVFLVAVLLAAIMVPAAAAPCARTDSNPTVSSCAGDCPEYKECTKVYEINPGTGNYTLSCPCV